MSRSFSFIVWNMVAIALLLRESLQATKAIALSQPHSYHPILKVDGRVGNIPIFDNLFWNYLLLPTLQDPRSHSFCRDFSS